jgi:large subunit ribosomal protein L4
VDTIEVDGALFGQAVRPELLKQAVVRHNANRRHGTASNKSRGQVRGSTRKIYRQKGTGFARMGTVRTCIRRGGGVAFAKKTRDFSRLMPRRMRRMARDQAVLSKLQNHGVFCLSDLTFAQPKTKAFVALLRAVDAQDGCLLATHEHDANVVKSARNLTNAQVRMVAELNAYDVLRWPKLAFTREAFDLLVESAKSGNRVIRRPTQAITDVAD